MSTSRDVADKALSIIREKRAGMPNFKGIGTAIRSFPAWSHIAGSGMGAVAGGLGANQASDGNLAATAGGALAGAAAFNPSARRMATTALRSGTPGARAAATAQRAVMHGATGAGVGGMAGYAADEAARAAGYDTNFSQYGAMAGGALGGARGLSAAARIMGRGPNAVPWLKPTTNRGGWTGSGDMLPMSGNRHLVNAGTAMGDAAAATNRFTGKAVRGLRDTGNAAWEHGMAKPLRAAWQFASGGKIGPSWMNAKTRMGNIGARLGIVGTAGTVGGGLYNAATAKVNDAVNNKIRDTYSAVGDAAKQDMDAYLGEKGLLNGQGKFDPVAAGASGASRMIDPLIAAMGMNPAAMSPAQKAMALGGPAAMGAGAGTGNPLLAMLGMGLTGAARSGHGESEWQGGQQGPQARNELEAQRARQMTGAGYL